VALTHDGSLAYLAGADHAGHQYGPSAPELTGRIRAEDRILSVFLNALDSLPGALGQLGAAIATCCSIAIANLVRLLFVRRSIGVFPFGGDIFAITAAGIGLAWGSNLLVTQFSLSAFWSTAYGVGCFVLAYGVASWTHLLNDGEKSGILRTLRDKVRRLSRNG